MLWNNVDIYKGPKEVIVIDSDNVLTDELEAEPRWNI
jgi:hypothetical protein